MISMCSFRSSIGHPILRSISGTYVLAAGAVIGDYFLFSVGTCREPELAELQQQASWRSCAATPVSGRRPAPLATPLASLPAGALAASSSNDPPVAVVARLPMIVRSRSVITPLGLHRQLPEHVIDSDLAVDSVFSRSAGAP